MQFRKVVQYVRLRFVPFLVAGVILVSPLSLCANAAVWEGSAKATVYYWGLNAAVRYRKDNVVTLPYIGGNDYEGFPIVYGSQVVNGIGFDTGTDYTFSSDVDVYISGFPWAAAAAGDTITKIGNPFDEGNYEVTYQNLMTGGIGSVSSGLKEITSFNPSVSDPAIAYPTNGGIEMRMQFAADEAYTISGLKVVPIEKCGWSFANGKADYYTYWRYTSIRVITAASSAELDELSNVADQIIAGNEILEAMKGDVVALLQQIYSITGDIEIAANKTNQMLTTLLGYVDGLEGQLGNIYSTLSSFTAQLISLLQANNQALLNQIQQSTSELTEILNEIRDYILEDDGGRQSDALDKVEQGSAVQEGLGELQRPDYEDIDTNVGDYVDQFDGGSGESDAVLNGFLGTIFESSMVTSMLMISLTFCMVAYVLYGKR